MDTVDIDGRFEAIINQRNTFADQVVILSGKLKSVMKELDSAKEKIAELEKSPEASDEQSEHA